MQLEPSSVHTGKNITSRIINTIMPKNHMVVLSIKVKYLRLFELNSIESFCNDPAELEVSCVLLGVIEVPVSDSRYRN